MTASGFRLMEPRINIVTLGVKNLDRSLKFYRDGLGWKLSAASIGDFAIFKMSTGTAIALFPRIGGKTPALTSKQLYRNALEGSSGGCISATV